MSGVFSWFSKFFGRLERREEAEPAPTPPSRARPKAHAPAPTLEPAPAATGVHHDPTLIIRLKDDHRSLLKQYAAIKTAATEGRWTEVHNDLLKFRAELTDHLLTESVKLYVYLRLKLSGDPVQLRLMRNFSSEMVGIGKVVVDFIEANEDVAINLEKQQQFMTGWGEIGKVLGDRVGREEKTLYPMYDDPIVSSTSTATH